MMRGVFLDRDTVDCGDLDLAALEVSLPEWRSHGLTTPEEVDGRIAGAAVVVTNKVMLDAGTLERHRAALMLVCVAATGTNNVDLEAAARLGIPVCNVVAYGTPSVVQHAFALILALTTRLFEYTGAVREGRWAAAPGFCLLDYPVRELAGKRIGIVGYGELGRGVARVAESFGLEVLVARRPGGEDQRPDRLPLDELLGAADIVTLHCPLTPATRNLIGAREIGLMRPDALLINTARGGIVDEAALAAALRAGRLGGAGFDVLSVEPPREGNPLLEPGIPNLILTPHTAWASREARQRVIDQVTENIVAFLHGEPRRRVV